jgi:1-carboxybiuret hydrolase subunit AtzG-like
MTADEDQLNTAIKAGAQMLGLTIEPAWMPSVRANLEVSLRLGKLVEEFPLPDDHEPASIFKA